MELLKKILRWWVNQISDEDHRPRDEGQWDSYYNDPYRDPNLPPGPNDPFP